MTIMETGPNGLSHMLFGQCFNAQLCALLTSQAALSKAGWLAVSGLSEGWRLQAPLQPASQLLFSAEALHWLQVGAGDSTACKGSSRHGHAGSGSLRGGNLARFWLHWGEEPGLIEFFMQMPCSTSNLLFNHRLRRQVWVRGQAPQIIF